MTIENHNSGLYGRINQIADNQHGQNPNQPTQTLHPGAQQYHQQPAPPSQQLQGHPPPAPIPQGMPTQLPMHSMSGKSGLPPEPPKQESKDTSKWWWISGAVILFVLYSIGNSASDLVEADLNSISAEAPTPAVIAAKPESEVAPIEKTYSIIQTSNMGSIKRSVDVRLTEKKSEQDLEAIAKNIMANSDKRYERTFITYYLPNMTIGAGAWATTHYNPDLKVKILGVVKIQPQTIAAKPKKTYPNMIGIWEWPNLDTTLRFYSKRGKPFVEYTYPNGETSESQLVETKSRSGRKFQTVKKSSFGDYWILKADGRLQSFDREGYIFTFITVTQ